MYRFYLAAVDMFPAALILIPVFWLLNRAFFHNSRKCIQYYLFACYLAVVYVLVGLPNVTYIRAELNLNLLPFAGMLDDWKNSILNILLFLPLGIMLPLLWSNFRNTGKTILFGFAMSLAIELLQILTFRATDVNDLITNTLGAYLGNLSATALLRKYNPAAENSTHELYIVIAAVLLSMFFIYPFVSAALWDSIIH